MQILILIFILVVAYFLYRSLQKEQKISDVIREPIIFDTNIMKFGLKAAPAVCVECDSCDIVGVNIKVSGFDVSDRTLSNNAVEKLKELINSDPCIPGVVFDEVIGVKGAGWEFLKPDGGMIVDVIDDSVNGYSTAPFELGNLEKWRESAERRIKNAFDDEGYQITVEVE